MSTGAIMAIISVCWVVGFILLTALLRGVDRIEFDEDIDGEGTDQRRRDLVDIIKDNFRGK